MTEKAEKERVTRVVISGKELKWNGLNEKWGDCFVCPSCEDYIFQNDNFCSNCGARIEWENSEVKNNG